ncbi:MAG TPA: single-stranded DNA-binding protein [Dyella sp.]|uniref:single-stranded DNA-binding protein n=1 Tax=Dyella sp. TaxID=1869338 RepID=UPI002B87DEA1|nr:single-stranded DNA-binding protein [Dyella sp.]HUB90465.1 single-stranded DNA-binding protein [Dyella sp.]
MARGVNKVILVGNLGADPEVRYTAGGSAIANLSVATKDQWTDKQTGQKQEKTEWHRVKMFGRLAEIAGEYLKKGQQVYVEGALRYDKYTGKDGVERYTTDIVASDLQMLGGRPGSEAGMGGGGGGYRERPQGGGAPRQPFGDDYGNAPQRQSTPPPDVGGGNQFDDDDIPF